MIDYPKRLVEVSEILNYLSEEDLNKIPEDIKKIINEKKDKDYIWKFDETKELKDQNLSRDTIAFLSYLNTEYLLDDKQKELMEQIYASNQKIKEKEKNEKYNPDDIFKNANKAKNNDIEMSENNTNTALVEYKESFFTKFKNFIFRILHINN